MILPFDRAAPRYDAAASLQAEVAQRLVARIAPSEPPPHTILDLGCGTGFTTQGLHRRWPQADLTALDSAPAMLQEAQSKIPTLRPIVGDAATASFGREFDLITSSMMAQWLPDPAAALARWQSWLKPQGHLHVALPIAGSLSAWRDLCRDHGFEDGLWPLPTADFALDSYESFVEEIEVVYESAHQFLRRLKEIGASTPRQTHRPQSPDRMRRLLAAAPQPFSVTYRILYIEMQSAASS